jgi:hypothetical protein
MPEFIIIIITFMQGVYNYTPDTNHFSTVYSAVTMYDTCNITSHVLRFVLYYCHHHHHHYCYHHHHHYYYYYHHHHYHYAAPATGDGLGQCPVLLISQSTDGLLTKCVRVKLRQRIRSECIKPGTW